MADLAIQEFVFILSTADVTLQLKNKIKKVYRELGYDVTCIFRGPQIFCEGNSWQNTNHVMVCIEFNRHYFIDMIRWIEKLRSEGFKGSIMLSMNPEQFDYGTIPKFLACGGSYIIDRQLWFESPQQLIKKQHDETVLSWLHNNAYQRTYTVENEHAIQHLFDELMGDGNCSADTLAYVYRGLKPKKKEELAALLKQNVKRIGSKLTMRPRDVGIKEGLITIWNNPELCCELGIQMAQKTEKRVLIVDLDRLNPTFDIFCPPKRRGQKFNEKGTLSDVQKLFAMNRLTDDSINQLCHSVKGVKSLKVLYGCPELKKFEYFTNEALIEALSVFRRNYDVVLLHVNKFIYDAYTCLAVIKSDRILMPIDGYLTTIRESHRALELLCEKQQIDSEKFFYVFFECEEAFSGEMKLLTDMLKRPIVGWISSCKKRRYCRNIKKAYGLTPTSIF